MTSNHTSIIPMVPSSSFIIASHIFGPITVWRHRRHKEYLTFAPYCTPLLLITKMVPRMIVPCRIHGSIGFHRMAPLPSVEDHVRPRPMSPLKASPSPSLQSMELFARLDNGFFAERRGIVCPSQHHSLAQLHTLSSIS